MDDQYPRRDMRPMRISPDFFNPDAPTGWKISNLQPGFLARKGDGAEETFDSYLDACAFIGVHPIEGADAQGRLPS